MSNDILSRPNSSKFYKDTDNGSQVGRRSMSPINVQSILLFVWTFIYHQSHRGGYLVLTDFVEVFRKFLTRSTPKTRDNGGKIRKSKNWFPVHLSRDKPKEGERVETGPVWTRTKVDVRWWVVFPEVRPTSEYILLQSFFLKTHITL